MRSNLFWLSDEQWAGIAPLLPTDVRGVRRQNDRYGSGLSGREDLAHLLIDVKRRLHGGSSVCVGWSVV